MPITFCLSLLRHCVLVQGSLSCCQILLEFFLGIETVCSPSFESMLSNFPQIACFNFIQYRRLKFSKSIFKTLIITCDIARDQSSVEMNKYSDQDRCRQTAKVIISGFLHRKTFVSIPFTTQISSFLKNDSFFCHFIYFQYM